MKIHCSLTSFLNLLFFFISLIPFLLSPSFCGNAFGEFTLCSDVYICGDLGNISYPFWGSDRDEYCGLQEFELMCKGFGTTRIRIDSWEYIVLKINQSAHRMTISRPELSNGLCPRNLTSTATLDGRVFTYSSNDRNISIWYDCPRQDNNPTIRDFRCEFDAMNSERTNYFMIEPTQTNSTLKISGCKTNITITVTVEGLAGGEENGTAVLEKALKQGFDVEYEQENSVECDGCKKSGGICAANATNPRNCICENGEHQFFQCGLPHIGKPSGLQLKYSRVAITLGTAGGIIMAVLCCCYGAAWIFNKDREIQQLIRSHATNSPKRYAYHEVKKITNSFQTKLGQGGFSTVYKGKLSDGRHVAVKLLNGTKETAQDFMNEIVSITTTSHVNVVTLLGFCFEWYARALIFEYMPNGSLDKYIFHKGSQRLDHDDVRLDWNTLYIIVVGVARGLEYLHRGSNTRILHFDIKPHNILLDDDFCPKISDFGLAKQCKAKDTHVSLTGAKGTVGFIAPEVIFRNLGKVSHKSDVYSYGMLILEMVGERKNPNQGVSQSCDEYFPDWIYKDLTETRDNGGFCWANTQLEEEIARKMIMVGMYCIQTMPDDRPSMTNVVSMLEGSLDCLPMPPKPTLFSPHRQAQASSSSTSGTTLWFSALSIGERVTGSNEIVECV